MGIGSDRELRVWALERIERAMAAIQAAVLHRPAGSLGELALEILAEASFNPVIFDRRLVTQTGVRPKGSTRVPQQSTTLVAPMTGGVELLTMRATTSRDDLLHARVFRDRVEVDVKGAALTQHHLDKVVDSLEQHVAWVNSDLAEYREVLERGIENAMAAAQSQVEGVRQAQQGLATPVRPRSSPVTDSPVLDPPQAPTEQATGSARYACHLPAQSTAWWRRQGTGNKIGVIGVAVGILSLVVAGVGVLNDIYPLRSAGNSPTPRAVTTSPSLSCPQNPGKPLLRVDPSDALAKVVFHGDGFPSNKAVEIHLQAPNPGSPTITYEAGRALADACGKFDLVWVVPSKFQNWQQEVDVVAATIALPSEDAACCQAKVVLDISRLLVVGAPITIISVLPPSGQEPGGPQVEVRLTGSQPPGNGHVYWLCAVAAGRYYPKLSVAAKTYAVPTSLEDQPGSWQILIVRADQRASAALQAALSADTYVEGLPLGAQVVSNTVTYNVAK